MKRKIFGVVSIGIVIIVIGVVCQILKKDSISQERKENTETIQQAAEEKVIEINQEIEGIEIKNIRITEQEKNKYTVVGEVENKTEEMKESRVVIMKCKDEEEKEEEVVFAVILPELARGETSNFSTVLYQDISKLQRIEIEQEKQEEEER